MIKLIEYPSTKYHSKFTVVYRDWLFRKHIEDCHVIHDGKYYYITTKTRKLKVKRYIHVINKMQLILEGAEEARAERKPFPDNIPL